MYRIKTSHTPITAAFPGDEPSGSSIGGYVPRSEMEKIMGVNSSSSVLVTTRRIFTGLVEETIEDVFTVVHKDHKKVIKTQTRDMGERTLIDS